MLESVYFNVKVTIRGQFYVSSVSLWWWIILGPPEPPIDIYLRHDIVPSVNWEKNFNGGYEQTFVVQTSLEGRDDWINHTLIVETDLKYIQSDGRYEVNIKGLAPGQYNIRLMSYNVRGWSVAVVLEQPLKIEGHDGLWIVFNFFSFFF